MSDIVTADWGIPQEQYYKEYKRIASTKNKGKNPYADYDNSILIQFDHIFTETSFEISVSIMILLLLSFISNFIQEELPNDV